jgi:hypothetical protein
VDPGERQVATLRRPHRRCVRPGGRRGHHIRIDQMDKWVF